MKSARASFIADEAGMFVEINQAFRKLLGYNNNELVNEPISILKSGKYNHQYYKDLWTKLLAQEHCSFEIYNRCKDGTILLFQEDIIRIKHHGKTFYIVTLEDITTRRDLENRQQYLATHDPLTGLANRVLLLDRFSQAVFHTKRKNKKIAIFVCDLNAFKKLNDTYGHNFGDKVLKNVAKNLKNSVRQSDTVARYGGDEFVMIIEQLDSQDEIKRMVESINKNSTIKIEDKGREFTVNMAIGYACYPGDGSEFKQLIEIADAKMYENKQKYYTA
nr:diguanylate cyclase [Sulfurimonas sp. MAG313]